MGGGGKIEKEGIRGERGKDPPQKKYCDHAKKMERGAM